MTRMIRKLNRNDKNTIISRDSLLVTAGCFKGSHENFKVQFKEILTRGDKKNDDENY